VVAKLPADEPLVAFLRRRRDEIVQFARELVATPSPNPPGDERAVAGLVVAKLRELGVEHVETAGATDERPNVLARVGGDDGPRLILCGHFDRPRLPAEGAHAQRERARRRNPSGGRPLRARGPSLPGG
jgi:hypothetical protein